MKHLTLKDGAFLAVIAILGIYTLHLSSRIDDLEDSAVSRWDFEEVQESVGEVEAEVEKVGRELSDLEYRVDQMDVEIALVRD